MTQPEAITTFLDMLVQQFDGSRVGTIEHGDMNGYGDGITATLELIDLENTVPNDDSEAYPVLSLDICADDAECIAGTLQLGWWDDEIGITDATVLKLTTEMTVENLADWLQSHVADFDVSPEYQAIAKDALPDFHRLAQLAMASHTFTPVV